MKHPKPPADGTMRLLLLELPSTNSVRHYLGVSSIMATQDRTLGKGTLPKSCATVVRGVSLFYCAA
jgi:hypothetical protein